VKITVENLDGIVLVTGLPDFIDASNAMEFKAEISTIIASNPKVIFDMSTVRFIDSAGCGALITSLRLLRLTGGVLKIYGVQKQVRSVFELVRMHKVIDIYNTREEALQAHALTR
jgi:anti-sigma B factor antagonist